MFGKRNGGQRGVNFIWPLAGGYLVYLGGKLLWMCFKGEQSSTVLSLLAGILFMVIGGLVIVREWHIYRNGPQQEDQEQKLPENTGTEEKETEE